MFLVCGFPRSRTAWLAAFLDAVHEPSIDWGSYDEALAFYRSGKAASDATQTLIAGRLLNDLPDLKVVVIERPRSQVEASARRLLGYEFIRKQTDRLERAIEALRGRDRVAFVSYGDLNEDGCKRIWNLVKSSDTWDVDRYRGLAGVNIQMDLVRHKERVAANAAGFKALYGAE